MRQIVLVYPEYRYPRKNPPLGLAYVAAYLETNGRGPLKIIDYNVHVDADRVLMNELASHEVDIVGISFMTNQFGEAKRVADTIKERYPNIRIVAGGPHVSAIPRQSLEEMPSVDIVAIGEGEETCCDLVKAIRDDADLADVTGIAYRENGSIKCNARRGLIADVDSLPFPAWHLLDLKRYSVFSAGADYATPTFALLSSRGCPGSCVFCDSHAVFDRAFRPRSAKNIYAEIESLHKIYGMVQFDFVDDLITLKKERVLELCDLLKESGIKYRWGANARVSTVTEEMLKSMAEAGCSVIDFGVESGDPDVRKIMRKGISDEQIISAHQNAQKVGMTTNTFLMVGNLGETPRSVRMTAELVSRFAMDTNIAIACPYPGTELYSIARTNGWLRVTDWNKFVTSPTYLPGYEPVMVTDQMNQDEIVDAYYYLHSFFVKRKFQARYGKFFVFNYHFLKNWLFKSSSQGGQLRKLMMALRLVLSRLKLSRLSKKTL